MNVKTQIPADTLPKLFLYQYQKYGDSRIALREKDRGIWKKYTWADYYAIVSRLTMAFLELGLQKDDKVSIIGENKPHIYWFELASLICRAWAVGIFSDCTAKEVKFFLEDSDSRFVVCQDQEQVDKILEIKDKMPQIKKVIYWEKKGMWSYDDPLLITMDEMMNLGKRPLKEETTLFEKMINETKGDDEAIIFYTSGTTGIPKGAVQTHQNIIGMAAMTDRRAPFFDTYENVSFLPIAWIAEQLWNVTYSLYKGLTVNFPESQETVQENIREVGPHIMVLSARIWEEYAGTIRIKMAEASWFNRMCFNVALKVGFRIGDFRMKGEKPGFIWRLLQFPADRFVFRPLKDRLGLSRAKVAQVGGTAVSPDVIRFFHALGVPLVQVYGSSEFGIATIHPINQIKAETTGVALDGIEIKISEDGEILVKSPCLFKVYYKNPQDTAKAVRNGWYRTGDFGRIDDDDHLIVMDRMADLQPIGGDKRFSPQFAETRLRFSAYIKEAIVVGSVDYKYAAAIINMDYDNVANWAEANHIPYTTFLDLSQKEPVMELIAKEIRMINEYLPVWARMGKFINLHKELDPDESELTRTRKVRRSFVEMKYRELIDALFSDKERIEKSASITYRDGTTGQTKWLLHINNIT